MFLVLELEILTSLGSSFGGNFFIASFCWGLQEQIDIFYILKRFDKK
jgi:hypothetical protein